MSDGDHALTGHRVLGGQAHEGEPLGGIGDLDQRQVPEFVRLVDVGFVGLLLTHHAAVLLAHLAEHDGDLGLEVLRLPVRDHVVVREHPAGRIEDHPGAEATGHPHDDGGRRHGAVDLRIGLWRWRRGLHQTQRVRRHRRPRAAIDELGARHALALRNGLRAVAFLLGGSGLAAVLLGRVDGALGLRATADDREHRREGKDAASRTRDKHGSAPRARSHRRTLTFRSSPDRQRCPVPR